MYLLLFSMFIKICNSFFLDMSISLHKYGSGVRLGVMADALISPEHAIITRTFPKSVENLANVVGVPRIPSRSPIQNLVNPSTSPGY